MSDRSQFVGRPAQHNRSVYTARIGCDSAPRRQMPEEIRKEQSVLAIPDWRECEGQFVGGEFPLERYLGGNETTAVFLTRLASGRAAIKVERADPVRARELVERWNRAAILHEPHLAAIYAAGLGLLAGLPVAYLVTEYAEENLAEVLHGRPLAAGETREMLLPVSDALAYLHSQGLVHGNLKPSNILSVGNTVKISSEAVSAGDPAEDIRALGVILVEALTQRALPDGQDPGLDALPSPFRELAEKCLQRDPERRWSAHKIAAWLRSPGQPPSSLPSVTVPATKAPLQKSKSRQYVVLAALTIVGAIVGVITMHRTVGPRPSAGESRPSLPDSAGLPAHSPASAASPIPPFGSDGDATRDRLAKDEILRRVLPNIPEKARNTIEGKPAVVVRVEVDPAGKVVETTLERSFSPYFSNLVLEAAGRWRFGPEETVKLRNWILRFEITRSNTQVTARRAGRE